MSTFISLPEIEVKKMLKDVTVKTPKGTIVAIGTDADLAWAKRHYIAKKAHQRLIVANA